MEVYKYNKCLLDRLEESMLVLPWKDELITAQDVRNNWACYIEFAIEPAGWQAIWNIPRVICEELHVQYPTAVFGHVEQVLFKEMRAVFVVDAVQDEDVHVMERHEVALEELWPTLTQENNALNVERTANCLDSLRFFYNHIWMPFDKECDDDVNWAEKHLESRIRFYYDLRSGCIKRALAHHIRSLVTEAKYLQQRREYLELGMSDDEADDATTLENKQVTDLMRLHLRLSMIRNEIEIVENPEMRRIYEQVYFNDEDDNNFNAVAANGSVGGPIKRAKAEKQQQCFVVIKPDQMQQQINLLRKVQERIEKDCKVHMLPALLAALNSSKANDKIFLSPGKHSLKFLEYLNENGAISGIIANKDLQDSDHTDDQAVIRSKDDDSMLLIFNGDYVLENLVLDCRNVRTGILIKSGTVQLRNCRIIGDGKSSTQQGIVCTGKSKLIMERCQVEKFANAIILNKSTILELNNSSLMDNKVGLEINDQETKLCISHTKIINAERCGILLENCAIEHSESKVIILNAFNELQPLTEWLGDCEFIHCTSNIRVMNAKSSLIAAKTFASIQGNDSEWEDCVVAENDSAHKILSAEE